MSDQRFAFHTDVGASMCNDIITSNACAQYRTKFYIFGYYFSLPQIFPSFFLPNLSFLIEAMVL